MHFIVSRSLGLFVASLIVFSAHAARPAKESTSTSSSLVAVPLSVTIEDANSSGAPYRIRSDGLGAYVHGSQNVSAQIDSNGNFIIDTVSNSRNAVVRRMVIDFSDPVDPANVYRPSPSLDTNYHAATLPQTGGIPLQELGINGNAPTQCVRWGGGFNDGSTTKWQYSFQKGLSAGEESGTAFAVVTRTSVAPAEWVVTPVGSCTNYWEVASLRSTPYKGSSALTFRGNYRLPFSFILRAN